jgi:hypothetical protein
MNLDLARLVAQLLGLLEVIHGLHQESPITRRDVQRKMHLKELRELLQP